MNTLKNTRWVGHLFNVLLLYFVSVTISFAGIKYVKPTGNDNNTGTSWGQAYQTIQKAIEVAVAGDEIWLASGTYYPTKDETGSASPTDARTKVFYINKNVAIYGGFNGTESSLSQRNWRTNIATLSGDIGAVGIASDNAYHVLKIYDVSSSMILDGVQITGGNANSSSGTTNSLGGGILVYGTNNVNSNPAITNCRIYGNSAFTGGGLAVYSFINGSCRPTFYNCLVTSNNGSVTAGGIYNVSDGNRAGTPFSVTTFEHCTFYENTASFTAQVGYSVANVGGGSTLTLRNCIAWGNRSSTFFGAAPLSDLKLEGGLYKGGCTSSLICSGSIVDSDPLFVDAAGGDFRLTSSSPAIDGAGGEFFANANALDYDGNPRAVGCVDYGAFEFATSNANTLTCYRDNDSDNYGNPAISKLFCTSCPSGWVQNAKDCDDTTPVGGSYSVSQSGTFAPISGTGTLLDIGDNQVAANIPIGFTFQFYGTPYTAVTVSSNGFVQFNGASNGCCVGQLIPNAGAPNNLIAVAWDYLSPSDGGSVDYFTTGTAPNRRMVINYTGIPVCCSSTFPNVNTQLILKETSNVIEIHTTSTTGVTPATMGVENADGTSAVAVPGRNRSTWTATNDFVSFTPVSIPVDTLTTFYRDQDGDGFGNFAISTQPTCSLPVGYVVNSTDCDDNDPLENPNKIWYKDTDNDGYAETGAATLTQCLRPTGYKVVTELLATSGDCNDNNNAIKPGATEVCDGVDNNCNGSIDEGASAPATPTASVTVQPTCTTSTGTIVVTAPVGGDIQYSIGGPYKTSGTFSGLNPGPYTVTAKNTTTGCISSGLSLTVNAVPSAIATPTASVTVQPTCTTPTGRIVVTAPVSGDIQYSVGGLYQSSGTFSGLNPGPYTVTAKNTTTGCISSGLSLTVNAVPSAPATPTASVTVQPTCTTPTGTIVVTAPSGTGIEYSIGGLYQSSGTFSGLNPGPYTVTAKNTTTGCISSGLSLTVNAVPSAPATPTASVTVQPTCTTPTGTIVVTAPSGTGIEYSIGGPYKTSGTFSGLNPGPYTVTAKNTTTGCISSSLSLTVNAVPSATATPTASVTVQPTCTTPTGTIVVTAPSGTGIEYSIGGLYQSSGTFSGLTSGPYTVTAKNTTTGCISSGLSLTVNAVPNAPATPTASVTVQPTCTTSTGTIEVTAPSGTGIEYSIGGLYQISGTFSGLNPGPYTVTAKNTTTGCISSGLSLTVNAVPNATATPMASVTVQPTCTTATGTIEVTAPSGTGIEYSIGGPYQSSGTFSGLNPGPYTVTAKNTTTGCISSSLSLTVNAVPSAPAIPTASVTVQPTCTISTGTIVVTAPVSGDIQYSIGGLYQSSGTFSGLNSGPYTVTAKNTTTGCISSGLSLTVNAVPNAPATPTASVTVQPTCTISTGTIEVTAPSGTGIEYSIGGLYQTSGTFSGLTSGSYTVTAKNTTTGCISSGLSLTVNAVPNATATPTASVTVQPTCTTSTGTIEVTAPAGSDIQYSIGDGYQTSGTFSGLTSGPYTVTAKNTTTGCISSGLSLTVNAVPNAPATPTASVTVQPTCTISKGTIEVTAPSGTGIEYSIGGPYQTSGMFSGLNPGPYTVTAKNTTTGCISSGLSLTVNAAPNAPATPTASVTVQPTCTISKGTIVVTAPSGTGIEYSIGGLYQTSGMFSGLEPGSYTVTAKNTATGCISSGLSLTVNAAPNAPATPTASVTVQPTCTISKGTIEVTAPSGTGIEYSIGGPYQTSGMFSGLNPGPYTVTAKNTTTGCISSGLSLTVNAAPSALNITTGTSSPICAGATSFTIPYTVVMGTPTTYSVSGAGITTVSNGALTNPIVVNLSGPASANAISYTLTVGNASGCVSGNITGSVTVVGPPTISLTTLQQTLNEGNNPVLCDTDANPVNSLQFNVSGLCVSGSPVWRVQVGSGAWSAWSATAPVSQPSNNQLHRYQAACDAACPSTYTLPIELTINNRATVPQNVSLVVDGVTVAVGETKEVCSLVTIPLTFTANCAAGEVTLYSVDGGEYSSGVPTGLVDNQFHNYRVRCRKSDGTPSCVESESGVMRLKLVTIPSAPTVSLSSTSSCDATASFSGQSTCGSLRTVWYNATTNVALPSLPSTVPGQTTSYYARCQTENGCVSEKSNVVTFTLTPTQVAPVITASQEIVCTGTTVTVSANCPAGSQTFWNTGVTTPSFQVAFNNVTKQTYWAKCLFEGGCQSAESIRKDIYWNAFVVTLINVGETKSSVKSANDKSLWSSQFITRDGGPELEQSTQQNPTLYFVENANKIAPRYWTINVEACGLSTDGSLTFDMLATPEMGVIRSFNTHENNAPYFMYANREGWTELYAQNHPAYGFYQDNGAGGNVYDAGLPKGLYKLGIRYWDMKGWGSIYPATRQPQGNVLAYQEYWFRIQSKDGVGVGAAREMATNLSSPRDLKSTDNVFAQVMPNPVTNVLRLKVQNSKEQVVQTTLTDATGRDVLRRKFVPETNTHQEEFGVSELPAGMYFLKVSTEMQQATLKVVKAP
ncbi:MAG: T9SS type A sorting domain-containing protein [Bacteroidetes bacterium]|nr:T9SS type A sorting domain-containing protein [Bacteroidota bacterium]